MSKVIINGIGGGGAGSDDCTARLSDIPAGLKAVTVDSGDEAGVGILTMTGNAQVGHVLAGETFYTNNYKIKQTGTMTVGSILSFSAQAYSGRQVLLKWQNPYAANGKPFSGVIVKYSTGTYPPWNGGTTIYVGIGDNVTPGGWSQIIVTMPATNTAYYFTALTYVTTSLGDLYGPNYDPAAVWQASAVTQADLWQTFTASQTYTIPNGYSKMDVFAVGGGGGGAIGGYESNSRGGGGGGGGYTTTGLDLNVSSGQIIAITIGTGGYWISQSGIHNVNGGDTTVTVNPSYTLTAVGGKTPIYSYGDDGGSGGGTAWINRGGGGASDGGSSGGKGQGRTTRAWGNGSGTLYSGGGGGGASRNINSDASGTGGAGGLGGGGAGGGQNPAGGGFAAAGGAPNTGGAGGGGGGGLNPGSSYGGTGGTGGTGIVLLKIY